MTDEEVKAYIDLAVQRSINEYKKSGLLKQADNAAYDDISAILKSYYDGGETDATIGYAVQGLRFDPYYRIIPMYFKDRKKVEVIAESLGVDVSTVIRNKKRLCLQIFNDIV